MARPLRIEYEGAVYHVTSRGDDRRGIFLEDTDRVSFLGILGDAVERFGWICHAYCLMTNHYHVFIETPFRGQILSFAVPSLENSGLDVY